MQSKMAEIKLSADELCVEAERIFQWISDLCNKDTRPVAMRELCDRQDYIEGLGPLMWHAFGAVSGLMQELIAVYVYSTALENEISTLQAQRVCSAIGLVQIIGSHPDTAPQLLHSQFMAYLLPLLRMTRQTRAVEHVRLSVMGVICGMLELDSLEVVQFFLGTELIPLMLRQLELGSRMMKIKSALVLHRIVENDVGLEFVCRHQARLLHLISTLAHVVHQLTLEPEPGILKHVVHTYVRLTDNRMANELLVEHLPEQLRNGYFCEESLLGYEQAPFELGVLNRKVHLALSTNIEQEAD
ncbi:CCR4-NOT transcription complex subunit 9 [Scaptodrosophila lebanonensis]|uniref:CCR4-NOT transcription complex subunit 9 n=1 Tax=Drosophila lebanonensis TaxID=7225 RepID=A0A6J2T4X5_DROLE|nr:CCR4-NOT transcription complex subunit 9 [Scaptodrosophila lebanonensis]